MKRATLTIEDLDKGTVETYSVEGDHQWSLTPGFRVMSAAIGAHPEEIGRMTAVAQAIRDMVAACAPPADGEPARA